LKSFPNDEPLHVVGLGSNLLVRDGGVRGTVVVLHGAMNMLQMDIDGRVYVGAGIAGAKLARFAAMNHLSGGEFFAGIPGTVGGMLAMNAGCYGSETWQKVERVMTMNRTGEMICRTSDQYDISYRHVALRKYENELDVMNSEVAPVRSSSTGTNSQHVEIFIAAWMAFEQGVAEISRQKIKNLLRKRIATQPLNYPNAGSVFRNPSNDYAARLIEESGLKGMTIGGAQVSEKHANFIVNIGGATALDIEMLIQEIIATVYRNFGIQLLPEVRIIGNNV
jgi:UDP-N-acetylmuramate dehydrogenase